MAYTYTLNASRYLKRRREAVKLKEETLRQKKQWGEVRRREGEVSEWGGGGGIKGGGGEERKRKYSKSYSGGLTKVHEQLHEKYLTKRVNQAYYYKTFKTLEVLYGK